MISQTKIIQHHKARISKAVNKNLLSRMVRVKLRMSIKLKLCPNQLLHKQIYLKLVLKLINWEAYICLNQTYSNFSKWLALMNQ